MVEVTVFEPSATLSCLLSEAESICGIPQNPVSPFGDLLVQGDFRRFLVARMGSTGSTWLAKLLNSHPEVYCTHEGVLANAFPRSHYGVEEIVRFVSYFAWNTRHHAYRTVGDVGSVWASHLRFLPFTTALLVRHPARMLHTRMKVLSYDRSFIPSLSANDEKCLRHLWGIEARLLDPEDQIFLLDAVTYLFQLRGACDATMVMRIEDMSSVPYVLQILHGLTGLDYDPASVEALTRTRVNRRAPAASVPEIVRGFTPRQREWYLAILKEPAASLGYDLMGDGTERAPGADPGLGAGRAQEPAPALRK
jgi:hypothetical protein